MTVLRAFLLAFALAFFFLAAAPLQGFLTCRYPKLADRLALLFCRTLLRILRVSVEVQGAVENGPVLLAANHVSWLDALALGSVAPFCFLAKREVESWPVLSRFAKVQGTVFVDRRRRRGIIPANAEMAARMLQGRRVLLFPEGTTFDGRQPGRFFSSHFAAARELLRTSIVAHDVTVQPATIAYSSAAAAWIGDDALVPHLWRVLGHAPIRCLIAFGPALAYHDGTDRKVMAAAARAVVCRLLAEVRATRPQFAWAPPGPTGDVTPDGSASDDRVVPGPVTILGKRGA